jgi:hypothetical protein
MQDTRKFKDHHSTVGPGLASALGPLLKGGERTRASEGLLEALHAGMGTRRGKTKCGEVKRRLSVIIIVRLIIIDNT